MLPWGVGEGDLGSFASRNHVSPKEKHDPVSLNLLKYKFLTTLNTIIIIEG
jgi:hypothetical protein